jgi:hypothetical protein
MMIAFGRRRLIFSLITVPSNTKTFDVPLAQSATDTELAHLNGIINAAEDRRRWEAASILYGGMRSR